MQLNLYIGSKLLSSVPLDPRRIGNESYLQSLRRSLISRYQTLIARSNQFPSCQIEGSPVVGSAKGGLMAF